MKRIIFRILTNFLAALFNKIKENPLQNMIILIISFIAIVSMSKVVVDYGIFPLVAYILACLYGIVKIIDNLYRPLVWGVGFILGAEAVKLIFTNLIPVVKEGTAVSLLSGLIVLYVISAFYFKAIELKRY